MREARGLCKCITFTCWCEFLLLARYVPNVAKRSTWEQCIRWGPTTDSPTDDQRLTDLRFWKSSNGHISATGHPIHVMFGSRWDFLGRWIEWTYFRLYQIQDSAHPPSLENFERPYLWNALSDPLSWITEQLWRNMGENNAREVIRLVTI